MFFSVMISLSVLKLEISCSLSVSAVLSNAGIYPMPSVFLSECAFRVDIISSVVYSPPN